MKRKIDKKRFLRAILIIMLFYILATRGINIWDFTWWVIVLLIIGITALSEMIGGRK